MKSALSKSKIAAFTAHPEFLEVPLRLEAVSIFSGQLEFASNPIVWFGANFIWVIY